jgi:cell division septal protein FtsQ
MKNQLPPQKVGNRTGIGSKSKSGVNQKPARRDRDSNETLGSRVRTLLVYAPRIIKLTLLVIATVMVFLGYRAAASASFFQIRTVETRGLKRASVAALEAAVRQDVKQTGVWRADLLQVSNHLEQLPWVRKAVVTRVLPDGIRVRIVEREPQLVVRTSGGRFVWVDDDAVFLDDMKPTDQVPTFFLRGWNEDDSATARQENRERVTKFLELQKDWDAQGLSERVSEVSLLDLRDVRAQLTGNDSQIEVRLGAQDHGRRLHDALIVLDRQRQTARGAFISYIDLSQGKRAIVGLNTGGRTFAETENGSDSAPAVAPNNSAAKEKDAKARAQTKKTEQKRT